MQIPSDYDPAKVVALILETYGGIIDELTPLDGRREISFPIPKLWADLAQKSKEKIIGSLWGEQDGHFPKYSKFLNEKLLGLYVGSGVWGTYLIYFLQDLERFDATNRIDGFLLAGEPSSEANIQEFERLYGRLPMSIRKLWQTHSFMYLWNRSLIASIVDPKLSGLQGPKFLGKRVPEAGDFSPFHCLAFANTSAEAPYCFVKLETESSWREEIFEAELRGEMYYEYTKTTLDELISRDW